MTNRAHPTLAARVLLVIAAGAFVACSGAPAASPGNTEENRVTVGISDAGCSPATFTAVAGQVRFVITNNGADVAEFEVIAADKHVIDEAENIIPGFEVNLASRLDGGTYELACGSLTAPRGALTVSGGPAATPPPNQVIADAALSTIVATYKAYVIAEADKLVTVVDAFTAKVDAGDIAGAKALYGPSRVPWERIEPVAELFSDVDAAIDSREDDFQGGASDPAFLGYHRLEKALWVDGSTAGLAPVTAAMRTAVKDLRVRLETLDIQPRVMARGSGELIDEVAQSKMTGEEDRYSKLDLWSIVPNVEGSREIIDLLRPALTTIDAAYLAGLDASYAAVGAIIARYGDETAGFKTFDQISSTDLKALQAGLADLSERLAELPGRLGLEG